ncbi:MAG: rRNA adenine N-6-methyltransferase family protein, partial [Candidatus Oleimicrobiaceae bacterium]
MQAIPARPKRSLGQHFLVDPNMARKIVRAFAPQPADTVVEIGPGRG